MDFLDYREKLGIGFCDTEKFKYFLQKIFNVLSYIEDDYSSGCIDVSEFYSFCNLTGTHLDTNLLPEHYNKERYRCCMSIVNRNTENMADFLSYYIAFTNSIKIKKYSEKCWTRKDFANLLVNMCKEAHIPVDLLMDKDEYFAFPKGVPEMDYALVSQPLEWLNKYSAAHTAWVKALKEYSNSTDENVSEVADKFRKALETFFQDFFGGGRSLEKYVSDHTYEQYLDKCGVPSDMRDEFKNTVSAYAKFINNNAKHHDKTALKVLEYLMYQTGNIIRLLITLRQEEQTDAD